jgi:hypothetical protein
MTTIEKGEKGNKAEIIIKAPPHFLAIIIYLFKARSEYALILGLVESQYPIRYENIPPIYERMPRIIRKRKGELNLLVHITKISGGIIPRKDSETRNTKRINPSERLSTIYWKTGFKSTRYLNIKIRGTITRK